MYSDCREGEHLVSRLVFLHQKTRRSAECDRDDYHGNRDLVCVLQFLRRGLGHGLL